MGPSLAGPPSNRAASSGAAAANCWEAALILTVAPRDFAKRLLRRPVFPPCECPANYHHKTICSVCNSFLEVGINLLLVKSLDNKQVDNIKCTN